MRKSLLSHINYIPSTKMCNLNSNLDMTSMYFRLVPIVSKGEQRRRFPSGSSVVVRRSIYDKRLYFNVLRTLYV
jgi:hypothetical protein